MTPSVSWIGVEPARQLVVRGRWVPVAVEQACGVARAPVEEAGERQLAALGHVGPPLLPAGLHVDDAIEDHRTHPVGEEGEVLLADDRAVGHADVGQPVVAHGGPQRIEVAGDGLGAEIGEGTVRGARRRCVPSGCQHLLDFGGIVGEQIEWCRRVSRPAVEGPRGADARGSKVAMSNRSRSAWGTVAATPPLPLTPAAPGPPGFHHSTPSRSLGVAAGTNSTARSRVVPSGTAWSRGTDTVVQSATPSSLHTAHSSPPGPAAGSAGGSSARGAPAAAADSVGSPVVAAVCPPVDRVWSVPEQAASTTRPIANAVVLDRHCIVMPLPRRRPLPAASTRDRQKALEP